MRRSLRVVAAAALLLFGSFAGAGAAAVPGSRGADASPSARASMAMTYDTARRQVVMFGGFNGNNVYGDTWTWDGTSWTERQPAASPEPRLCAAMAYDPIRRVVVLFGGTDNYNYYSDTWTWDGTNWTKQNPATSPDLTCFAGMAFDAAMQQIVIHGFLETWSWDGTTWTKQSPRASPSYREAVAMSNEGQNVLLFGGDNGPEQWKPFGDTWRYVGGTWRRLFAAVHPQARTQCRLVSAPPLGGLVLFGGTDSMGTYFDDTWIWNGSSWTLTQPATSPPGRDRLGLAYDAAHKQVVLFGGRAIPGGVEQYFGDTWTWDGTTWTQH